MMKTIFAELVDKFDLASKINNFTIKDIRDHVIKCDISGVADDINLIDKKVGLIPWQSTLKRGVVGCGLIYDPLNGQQYLDTFGDKYYTRYSSEEYFKMTHLDLIQNNRGMYLDTYRYTTRVDVLRETKNISRILDLFSLDICRATIRKVIGSEVNPTRDNHGGYHIDSSPFESIRLNLAISNNGDYGLQYINKPPLFFNEGDMRLILSDVEHRLYVSKFNTFDRVHLVIDIVPWFKKDSNNTWVPNEFCGKMHPYDMIREGLIFK